LGLSRQGRFAIDIHWADERLGKDCASDDEGRRRFGAERWPILRRRLATLAAARTLDDLRNAPGRVHALRGNRRGQFGMSLWGSVRLVFKPSHPRAHGQQGAADSILIVEIVDYHD
jgi:toxin HigB-1